MLAWLYCKIGKHLFKVSCFGDHKSPKDAADMLGKSYKWLSKAAEKGSYEAMLILAAYSFWDSYRYSEIVPGTEFRFYLCNKVIAEAPPKWVAAAKRDYAGLVAGSTPQDEAAVKQALAYLSELLETTAPMDSDAALTMGSYYARGLGVPKDIHCALAWFLASAKAGNIRAMVRLSEFYREKDNPLRDETKSQFWLDVAKRQ